MAGIVNFFHSWRVYFSPRSPAPRLEEIEIVRRIADHLIPCAPTAAVGAGQAKVVRAALSPTAQKVEISYYLTGAEVVPALAYTPEFYPLVDISLDDRIAPGGGERVSGRQRIERLYRRVVGAS